MSSVLAASDTALSDAPAALNGSKVIVRGSFSQVYSGDDTERNLVTSSSATEVSLDSRTGEVEAVH